jgi:hypothetical protein
MCHSDARSSAAAAPCSLLDRAGTGRGTRRLREAIDQLAASGAQVTRSELEIRFLSLIAQARLPRPLVNATVQGLEVDFLWPTHDLVVETDGAATHLTATEHPHTIERTLRALLGEPAG